MLLAAIVTRRFEDESPIEALLARWRLGFWWYVKTAPRDPEKTAVLMRLALAAMDRAEYDDYIALGPRRRHVKTSKPQGRRA